MLPRAPVFVLVVAAALLLGACGGGVFIGYDSRDFDDRPPSVQLAASPADARPAQVITLVAAASDDDGIDSVAFFRLDANGDAFLLGSDGVAPYQWDTALPGNATGSVEYFARATDSDGQRADSAVVSVGVLP